MNSATELLTAFAVLTGVLYSLLRWGAAPAMAHLAVGAEYGVNLFAAGLLYPEYLCTRVARRTSGRAAPFAYTYGDSVCGLACGIHRCVDLVTTVLHGIVLRLGDRTALGVSALLSALLLYAVG